MVRSSTEIPVSDASDQPPAGASSPGSTGRTCEGLS
jgi:hypothetical protein